MSILENWGDSVGNDWIRAQVAGLAPERRWGRLLMVMQSYADDSTSDGNNFVLAGYIASAAEWMKFSDEWAPLAKAWGTLQPDGNYVFKMADMAWLPERMERVAAFFRVIERHQLYAFSFGLNKDEYRRAVDRLIVTNYQIDIEDLSNPFYLLFNYLTANLIFAIDKRPDIFPEDDQISFYFDEQREKARIWSTWDRFIADSSDKFKRRIAGHPIFDSDARLIPLQAADFWAWWNSHWLDTGETGFEGMFEPKKLFLTARHYVSEEEAVHVLKKVITRQYPDAIIYDRERPWRPIR